jgi:hypothetical protein
MRLHISYRHNVYAEQQQQYHHLPTVQRLLQRLPINIVLPAVPVAAQGVSWLLCVPGASSTVLEVVVPYSRGSLVTLLCQVRW